ncbi:MAG: SseB family protein, partial [Cellulomonadaceae bacterium]
MTADSSGVPWEGRNLKSNPFAGDDGTAEPALAAALEAFRADPTALIAVVDALSRARVLVPVLAELAAGGQGEHGQT